MAESNTNIEMNCMSREERAFIDTNILAYAFDRSDERKRNRCSKLVSSAFQGEANYFVSTQVLCELFDVLTTKVAIPLSYEKASVIVSSFIESPKWKKVNHTHLTVRRALEDLESVHGSFWDVLMAETMRETGVSKIYTENEKDFAKIPWIEARNPITEPIH